MHTTCPECSSVFRVTAEQLNIAHGQVRCGYCQVVFDALGSLEEDWKDNLPEPEEMKEQEEEQVEHVLVVDEELLEEVDFRKTDKPNVYEDDEDLPLDEILADQSEPSSVDDKSDHSSVPEQDSIVDEDEPSALSEMHINKHAFTEFKQQDIKKQSESLIETLQEQIQKGVSTDAKSPTPSPVTDDIETVIANDTEITDYALGNATPATNKETQDNPPETTQADDIPDILKEELAAISDSASMPKTYLWIAGIVVLSISLILQTLYYFRDDLARDENYRGIAVTLCKILSCKLPLRNDAAQGKKTMVMRSHSINRIKEHDDQLRINMIFTNTAKYEQAYPILSIKMMDESQRVTALRHLPPEKYLGPHINIEKGLPANTSVEIFIDIIKPSQPVISYQFEFS